MPSRPMLTTPERSEKRPPSAAKTSGVAKRSVAANRPAVTILSIVTVWRWTVGSDQAEDDRDAA